MKIGNFDFNSNKTFIIAELSANHNGNLDIALDTIKAAKEIGADAIKIQTYRADTITLNSKKDDFLISGGTLWDGKNLYELYEEAHTPWEWHKEIFSLAKELDLLCFSSPFDRSAVDFLEKFDPPAYKIASFEITDYDLVEYVAKKNKPIIISTGIATIDEIQDVIEICKNVGNEKIILLKCTSAYPAPLEDANLKMIPSLAETFNVISGFSDHTIGSTAPIAAVTLGARVIEKHFILDKSIGGADADFSMEKEEFKLMIQNIRDLEKLLGKVDYSLDEKRLKSRRYSRSLYSSQEVNKGDILSLENIKSVRPGFGLHPKHLKKVLGKKANKNIPFATPLSLKDFD